MTKLKIIRLMSFFFLPFRFEIKQSEKYSRLSLSEVETLRDIRTSTYQIVRIEENTNSSVNKAHFVTQPNFLITPHNKPPIYGPYVCRIFNGTEIAFGRYIKTKWVG